MILIYVRHYLNDAGKKYFTETWFPKVQDAIKVQPGFVSIEASNDLSVPDCKKILLKFKTREQLEEWAKTPLHDSLVDNLDPYRVRDWHVATYENESGEPVDENLLSYETVVPRTVVYPKAASFSM